MRVVSLDGWRNQHVLVFNFFRYALFNRWWASERFRVFSGKFGISTFWRRVFVCVYLIGFFVLKRGKNNGVSFEMWSVNIPLFTQLWSHVNEILFKLLFKRVSLILYVKRKYYWLEEEIWTHRIISISSGTKSKWKQEKNNKEKVLLI